MQRIKEVRESASLSARELATVLGLSPSAIGHYENERRVPGIKTCWRIVQALNALGAQCSFEDVFPNPQSNSSEA